MVRFRSVLVWALLLAIAATQSARAAPTIPATNQSAPDRPRIVLQSQSKAAEVAAWSPDDHLLVTANSGNGSGEVVVWDAASGTIINRIALPLAGQVVRLTGMDVSADGNFAFIDFLRFPEDPVVQCVTESFRVGLRNWNVSKIPARGTVDLCTVPKLPTYHLPPSHDGKLHLVDTSLPSPVGLGERVLQSDDVLHAVDADGSVVVRFSAPLQRGVLGAALSPDGAKIAALVESAAAGHTRLLVFSLQSSNYAVKQDLPGKYRQLTWIDSNVLLASGKTSLYDRYTSDDSPGDDTMSMPTLEIDTRNPNQPPTQIEPRCFVAPLGSGRLIGAGEGSCQPDRELSSTDLEEFRDGQWQPFAADATAAYDVEQIAVSPDRSWIAVVGDEPSGSAVLAIDAASGVLIGKIPYGREQDWLVTVGFAYDGTLLIADKQGRTTWKPGQGAPRHLAGTQPDWLLGDPIAFTANGKTMVEVRDVGVGIDRFDLASHTYLPALDIADTTAAGFTGFGGMLWLATRANGIQLWNANDWSNMLTAYLLPGDHFLVVTPDGRYDTDLPPDSNQFHWLMPDAPLRPLDPQTFMRDFYEPRLASRLVNCSLKGDCARAFASLPPMQQLNRVLPQVAISGVKAGSNPGQAIVTLRVAEGVEPAAANGKTRSGAYDLRLFRDGRLVAQVPAPSRPEGVDGLAAWRAANAIPGASGGGVATLRVPVELPTAADAASSAFSAYAFNEDRIKGVTAHAAYTRPPVAPHPPRAIVIAIGIDAYDIERLNLQFSANDAKLMSKRLADIPGYVTQHITLAGSLGPDGKKTRVTRAAVLAVLQALGKDASGSLHQRLGKLGFDVPDIAPPGPDDLVIITWSGHGWTDARGNFFLLPSDTHWIDGADAPDPASMISAADLTYYLTPVQAANIALVIDACHSAASVEASGFKPGPMGDPGLGQLAYDKGIRILAASQADDVALETASLRHGLLSYALAGEALGRKATLADANHDGQVTLAEWLHYGVARLPGLSRDVRLGRLTGVTMSGFRLLDGPAASAPPQEPALFDFIASPKPVVIERVPS